MEVKTIREGGKELSTEGKYEEELTLGKYANRKHQHNTKTKFHVLDV